MSAKPRTANRGRWLEPLPVPVFPNAQSATLAEAPPSCGNCGGPWRLASDGLQCRVCSRHHHVGEMLAGLVGHTLDHEAGGHVNHERTAARKGC